MNKSAISKKEQITTTTARLFRKRGYNGTSMRDIAEEMGIKAPSLYNHIKSKQEILQHLLLNMANRFTKNMTEIKTSKLSAEEKMEALVKHHVKLTVQYTDAISLITSEWVHLEEPAKSEYLQLRDKYETDFKNILIDCINDNYFKQIDPEIALFSILSTLRWLYSWYSKNRKHSHKDLEQQMISCLIDGLRLK